MLHSTETTLCSAQDMTPRARHRWETFLERVTWADSVVKQMFKKGDHPINNAKLPQHKPRHNHKFISKNCCLDGHKGSKRTVYYRFMSSAARDNIPNNHSRTTPPSAGSPERPQTVPVGAPLSFKREPSSSPLNCFLLPRETETETKHLQQPPDTSSDQPTSRASGPLSPRWRPSRGRPTAGEATRSCPRRPAAARPVGHRDTRGRAAPGDGDPSRKDLPARGRSLLDVLRYTQRTKTKDVFR